MVTGYGHGPVADPVGRRRMLELVGAGLGAVALAGNAAVASGAEISATSSGRRNDGREIRFDAQTMWDPYPTFGGIEHDVEIQPGVTLRVWETPGRGPTIFLLHPASGSGEVFNYQHVGLGQAGYRVISYSRRGFYGSSAGPMDQPGNAADDLIALADRLAVRRLHVVGNAAGGFSVFDLVARYRSRILSGTVACSLAGISEPAWTAATTSLLPPTWDQLPTTFREVGPSYRAANPTGLAEWHELEQRAQHTVVVQGGGIAATWEAIEEVRLPLQVMTGDADLYLPPSRARVILDHVRRGRGAIISEAGHAAFWEQPDAYNDAITSFVRSIG